ncbi:MAG: hypothetical protein L0338_32475, partial [Acidobacteria bacterium]|nr:hypothetical protein [Acidobacteriota bacterium]
WSRGPLQGSGPFIGWRLPMIIARIIQLQFLLLLILLVCASVAGEKDAVFWFIIVTLPIGALILARKIHESRR